MNERQYKLIKREVLGFFEKANIVLTNEEKEKIEIADFGLNNIEKFGLQLIEYINTSRCCAKDLVLLPNQICPEHLHPPINEKNPGKEETFRCRFGTVYLYVPGSKTSNFDINIIPKNKRDYFTVFKEIKLNPGEQYTIEPNTLHWFRAGEEGAIVSEFSTESIDEKDIFTDPYIKRVPNYDFQ